MNELISLDWKGKNFTLFPLFSTPLKYGGQHHLTRHWVALRGVGLNYSTMSSETPSQLGKELILSQRAQLPLSSQPNSEMQ